MLPSSQLWCSLHPHKIAFSSPFIAFGPRRPVHATDRPFAHHLPPRLPLLSNQAVLLFLCLDHGTLQLISAVITIDHENPAHRSTSRPCLWHDETLSHRDASDAHFRRRKINVFDRANWVCWSITNDVSASKQRRRRKPHDRCYA